MRLMVIVVRWMLGSGHAVGGRDQCNGLQRLRVMRGHTHRSHERKSTLHRQEATEQNNDHMSEAWTHTRDGNTDG